jgi:hypothetical protein
LSSSLIKIKYSCILYIKLLNTKYMKEDGIRNFENIYDYQLAGRLYGLSDTGVPAME